MTPPRVMLRCMNRLWCRSISYDVPERQKSGRVVNGLYLGTQFSTKDPMSEYNCISANSGASDSVWGSFEAFRTCLISIRRKLVLLCPCRPHFRAFLRTRPLRDMSTSCLTVLHVVCVSKSWISRLKIPTYIPLTTYDAPARHVKVSELSLTSFEK